MTIPTEPAPFYLDWTFWAVLVALIALVLSQLPPIRLLIKPARLEVEVNGRVHVSHQIGNPIVGLHVSLSNLGGRELRVHSIEVSLSRNSKHLTSLPVQSYFEKPTDQRSILFVPFSLKPGEHWSHGVIFVDFFDRNDEMLFRSSRAALRNNIDTKRQQGDEGDGRAVRADSDLVAPFLQLFQRLYKWEPGEYIIELTVKATPALATRTKRYRFTLYESDDAELRKYIEDYTYGASIYFDTDEHSGVHIPLSEHLR